MWETKLQRSADQPKHLRREQSGPKRNEKPPHRTLLQSSRILFFSSRHVVSRLESQCALLAPSLPSSIPCPFDSDLKFPPLSLPVITLFRSLQCPSSCWKGKYFGVVWTVWFAEARDTTFFFLFWNAPQGILCSFTLSCCGMRLFASGITSCRTL